VFWCCSSDVVRAAKRCIERLALTFIQQRAAAAAVAAQQAASASSGFGAGAARVASSAPTRIQQPPSGEPVTPLVSAAPAYVSLFLCFTCIPFSLLVCMCVQALVRAGPAPAQYCVRAKIDAWFPANIEQ
jgi:hypothetical protein